MPPLPPHDFDAAPWQSDTVPSVTMGNAGLVLGLNTVIAPMGKVAGAGQVSLDPERVLVLLSILARRPLAASALTGIERAAEHWRRGDKALANLRLIFAGLPRCDTMADAARLHAADWLLAHGMTPRGLMKELGLDTAALDAVAGDLAKYNPDQPRVPAGSGAESGRWTDGNFGLASPRGLVRLRDISLRPLQVAANGPFTPNGVTSTEQPFDPLDPAQLNQAPPTLKEQQGVVDTLNTIRAGDAAAIKALQPHPYRNLPQVNTGALLPPAVGQYTSYNVLLGSTKRGSERLVIDSGSSQAFYTNNHYLSYYAVDVEAPK